MPMVLVLLMVFFFSACSYSNDSSTNSDLTSKPECSTNSECISVASDCCGCTAGGSNKALSSKEHQQWLQSRAKNCASTICPSVMSKHESCTALAVCIDGKCQLEIKK